MTTPRRLLALLLIVAGSVSVASPASADPTTGLSSASLASAPLATATATSANFTPGYIISDGVFYNDETMTVAQIQTFLATKGANCVSGSIPCLKDYTENTYAKSADSYCKGYTARTGESASQIIANVAASCGVNPQVLLVTLQKEQGLVTTTSPTARKYQIAMGFGCPDNAPCVEEYYGFQNQIYRAARQFQVYEANPTRYGYQAGRSNYIQYNPNAACGGTNVTIENQATAALYIYTPYQPNQAAINAGYGTGDSCSSYGNRNFWRYFRDWFGDPRVDTAWVKSASSSTVYLISAGVKQVVPDWGTLVAFGAQSRVTTVGSQYLTEIPDGPTLTRVARIPETGDIILAESGTSHRFASCTTVVAYGAPCSTALPSISLSQASALASGPAATDVIQAGSTRYLISGGTRREVLDGASLTAAGVTSATFAAGSGAVDHLPLGVPVASGPAMVTTAGTSAKGVLVGATIYPVNNTLAAQQKQLSALRTGSLSAASVAKLTTGVTIAPVLSTSSGSYLITTQGKALIATGANLGLTSSAVPGEVAALLTTAANLQPRPMLKSVDSSTIAMAANGAWRPVESWTQFLKLTAGGSGAIVEVPSTTAAAAPVGPMLLTPGTLVKTATDARVYFAIDGDRVVYLDDFNVSREFGVHSWATVDAARITASTLQSSALSSMVRCADGLRVVIGGTAWTMAGAPAAAIPVTELATATCAAYPSKGSRALPVFVKSPTDAKVYSIDASKGTRHWVKSWGALVSVAGTSNPTIAVLGGPTVASIPEGGSIG